MNPGYSVHEQAENDFCNTLYTMREGVVTEERQHKAAAAWQLLREIPHEKCVREWCRAVFMSCNPNVLEQAIAIIGTEDSGRFLLDLSFLQSLREKAAEQESLHPYFVEILKRAVEHYGYAFERDSVEAALSPLRDSQTQSDAVDAVDSRLKLLKQYVSTETMNDPYLGSVLLSVFEKHPLTSEAGHTRCIRRRLECVRDHLKFDVERYAQRLLTYGGRDLETMEVVKQLLPTSSFKESVLAGIVNDTRSGFELELSMQPVEVLSFLNGLSDRDFCRAANDILLSSVLAGRWIDAKRNFQVAGDPIVQSQLRAFVDRCLTDELLKLRIRDQISISKSQAPTVSLLLVREMATDHGLKFALPDTDQNSTFQNKLADIVSADIGKNYLSKSKDELIEYLALSIEPMLKVVFGTFTPEKRAQCGFPEGDLTLTDQAFYFVCQVYAEDAFVELQDSLSEDGESGDYTRAQTPVRDVCSYRVKVDRPKEIYDALWKLAPDALRQQVLTANPDNVAGAIYAKYLDESHIHLAGDQNQTKLMISTFDM
ncbi:hypothetical protein HNP46_000489 [Pseudomonas nitritireducens]|uniref:Uncharacterized protein n=1 Tax=Pseudomonas nitroreducens TaxID=46680 RepID=A0A7W7KGJ1_PSENT|nr:hypothetical protein [Pseudomonas nitritireducens]MBB4861678.1 hypothetical protein [Pseudomonas nitritireducens]